MKSIKKSNVMRLLEQAGIEYEAFEYDGEGGRLTGEQIAEKAGQPVDLVCKTLVTCTEHKEYFVFVINVKRSLDLKLAAKAASVKALTMLPLNKLFPLTGYMHGGCSPVGIKTSMKVFIDEPIGKNEIMYVSGGRIGLNVKVNPAELANLVNATFAPVSC
jgi:Cys-tRNA(Pro)/Cys-tRNA(Cys) deacylase